MIKDLYQEHSRVVAVVPMKPLHLAKTRLADELDSSQRGALAMGMFAKVVTAALESELVEVWVIGGDFPASERSRYPDVRWLDDPGMGLNEALSEAMKLADAAGYACLYLPADLPFLRSSDIAAMLSASDGGSKLTLVAAHHDGGTNAMLVPAQSGFRPLLGNHSFRRHVASALARGMPYAKCVSPGFALDLDTPSDLVRCEGLEPGFLERMTSRQEFRPVQSAESTLGLSGND